MKKIIVLFVSVLLMFCMTGCSKAVDWNKDIKKLEDAGFVLTTDFEDAIRNAISVGGDSDTIAAITGSVAEAYYGVPEGIIDAVIGFLDSRQMEILYYFEKKYTAKAQDEDGELLSCHPRQAAPRHKHQRGTQEQLCQHRERAL